jgi:hypothetical protein
MTKSEDSLKKILNEINEEHQIKIDNQIYGIFLFGFISGYIFSYTGFMGFFIGLLTGLVIRNTFSKKSYETIEKISDIFYSMLNKAKNFINL